MQQQRNQWTIKQAEIKDWVSKQYISFPICLPMNSLEWAVTLSVLLQRISNGIFFLTTLPLVNISYRYLITKLNRDMQEFSTSSSSATQEMVSYSMLTHIYTHNSTKHLKHRRNYSEAARQFGKKSTASTTNTMAAALGKYSSSLGRSRECPGTSTTQTGFTLRFCQSKHQTLVSFPVQQTITFKLFISFTIPNSKINSVFEISQHFFA